MDARLSQSFVIAPPPPGIYATYASTSSTLLFSQIHSHPVCIVLALLCLSLTLITGYPWRPRIGGGLGEQQPVVTSTHLISSKYSDIQRRLALQSIQHRIERAKLMRENARLTSALRSLRKGLGENAFSAFRDRLLLFNRVWKQDREISALRAAGCGDEEDPQALRLEIEDASAEQIRLLEAKLEALELARVAEMEERDALDERRERLVASLVKEIAADLEESQRQVESLRSRISRHDREVEEIHNDWLQDNQKLAREVAKLKLSGQQQQQRPNTTVEQEVSNDLDQTLCDELWEDNRRKAEIPEEKINEYDEAVSTHFVDGEGMEESFSDIGSPTSTVAGDLEGVDVLEELLLERKVGTLQEPASPSEKSTFFRPPPAYRFSPVLHVHPQSPAALAMSNSAAYTTSSRLLARCKRARSTGLSLKFPLWSSPVSGTSTVTGRSAKRARIDSSSV